jgi:asparagine synthase (glutamine-hydrolysing)
LSKLDTSNDDEIIEEFLQIYETAVRRRILPGHKIGSHLSGGLDSGSVSWLASKVLKAEGRPLLGLTGTELFDTSSLFKGRGNEEQYAQITAEATGHIELHAFKCEGVSMIDSIRHEVNQSLNLSHGVGNIFWIHAISEFAKENGIDTILVGQVGNASVTWAGKGGKSHIKKEILDLINTIKMRVLVRNKTVQELDVYPFTFFLDETKVLLNPVFMKRHTLKELQRYEVDEIDSHRPSWVHGDRLKLLNFRSGGIGSFWEMMSIDYGMYHWDPTSDQDLVEFCLRLPESYYAKNGGRNLVRRAFDGKIPDEVLYKKLKGRQSSDWMIRFSHEIPQFNVLLDSIPGNHPFRKYIDVEAFRNLVLDWEKGFRENDNLGHPILSGTISRVLGLYFLLEVSG